MYIAVNIHSHRISFCDVSDKNNVLKRGWFHLLGTSDIKRMHCFSQNLLIIKNSLVWFCIKEAFKGFLVNKFITCGSLNGVLLLCKYIRVWILSKAIAFEMSNFFFFTLYALKRKGKKLQTCFLCENGIWMHGKQDLYWTHFDLVWLFSANKNLL